MRSISAYILLVLLSLILSKGVLSVEMLDGYEGAKFGMSYGEVKKLIIEQGRTITAESKGTEEFPFLLFFAKAKVIDENVWIYYHFTPASEQLFEVSLDFAPESTLIYDKAKGILVARYGPTNISERKTPREDVWNFANGNIIDLHETDVEKRFTISYRSVKLAKINDTEFSNSAKKNDKIAEDAQKETVLNSESVKELVSKLNSDDYTEQMEAYKKLSKLKDPQSIPFLIDICRNEESKGYIMASELLGEIGEPSVKPLINAMVNYKENWSNFVAPLNHIGRLAVPSLAEMLEKEAKQVKNISDGDAHYVNFMHILTCLQGIGTPAVPYLEKFVETCDYNDLKEAVKFAVNFIKSTSR